VLVTREYFGDKVMETAYGGIFLISTVGMGLGSFAGGWFYDRLGAYTWLSSCRPRRSASWPRRWLSRSGPPFRTGLAIPTAR
jgi:hypothetical protein